MSKGAVIFSVGILVAVFLVLGTCVVGMPSDTDLPGCHSNEDCDGSRVCSNWKCTDPCLPNICGENTLCYVANHKPICCGQRHIITGEEPHSVYQSTTVSTTSAAEYSQHSPSQPKEKQFYLNTIVKVNWHQALAHCRSTNMHLASFESQEEYSRLINLIKKTNVKNADFWVSGSDLGEHGRFLWMSTGKPISSDNWNDGEPNHFNFKGEIEHCVSMEYGFGYKMNDKLCSDKLYHVCQHY